MARPPDFKIPREFRALGPQTYRLGAIQREVSLFEYGESRFVLLPGGRVELGFNGRWEPTSDELDEWRDGQEEDCYPDGSPLEFVESVTSKARTVDIPPFLMEVESQKPHLERLPSDDPVFELLRDILRLGETLTLNNRGRDLSVTRKTDGSWVGYRVLEGPHYYRSVVAKLASQGFRLPSADEWEYACAAGARTLFRWGDHAPFGWYPGGRTESDWNLHELPNAFGLLIGRSPYDLELLNQPGLTRGGDGGCNVCGGVGYFLGWLPLASSWCEKHDFCNPEEPLRGRFVRRVLQLE